MEKPSRSMRDIPPSSLTHLPSRVAYLKAFQGFTEADGELIHSTAPLVKPLLPTILNAVYTKLLSFNITAKAFVPRQPGYDGGVPANVEELTLSHPQILHRKDFLRGYLVKLVTNEQWDDDSNFWTYLDRVGIMHTGQPGFERRKSRPELRVEYVHMGMLLGYVEDVVVGAILGAEGVEWEKKVAIVRAFNKLLWIQNDLFAQHYVIDRDTGSAPGDMQQQETGFNLRPQLIVVALLASMLGAIFSKILIPFSLGS